MKKVIVMLDCVLSFSTARTSRNQYRRGSSFLQSSVSSSTRFIHVTP